MTKIVARPVPSQAASAASADQEQSPASAQWEKQVIAFFDNARIPGTRRPSLEGATKVSPQQMPADVRARFDEMRQFYGTNAQLDVYRYEVAGSPAFLVRNYDGHGTDYALFDAAGREIEFRSDDV